MQNVGTIVRRPISLGSGSAGVLIGFMAGGLIALSVPTLVAEWTVSRTSTVTVATGIVGAQQIAHNRSEEGLDGSQSVSGQQIAHNRSEEGLTNP